MFITLHSIVSLVFSLKVSKLECVDEAVHGCGHLIRAQVIDKYEEVMLGYQAKCSRRVREPSSAGKIIPGNSQYKSALEFKGAIKNSQAACSL